MYNVFTIDTEDWYHANFEGVAVQSSKEIESIVERNVDRFLELFDLNNVKATFFILGCMAEEHPEMVKKIADLGHEVASHGYSHQLAYKQTSEEFKDDVYRSKRLIEDLIGKRIYGYRAPSWSITEKSLWALDILEELGFKYNSSIFPTKNFLYGIPYAPRFMHDATVYNKSLSIKTIPPSTYKFYGVNIPFSGGAYFRILPTWVIKKFTNIINGKEKMPVIFYLHPREIDPKQPRLKLSFKDYLIHYYGVESCEKKLIDIISNYSFITMYDYFKGGSGDDVYENISNSAGL